MPRKRLEVIVDTCSMGAKKMRGVNALIAQAMHQQPPVFSEYRIVMPLQLGTEARQRMFPEFLAKEFEGSTKDQGLDAFMTLHRDHARIVDTVSSKAFTFYYAQRAVQVLRDDPALRAMVLKEATHLAARYGIDASITSRMLRDLCHHVEALAVEHAPRQNASQQRLQAYHDAKAGDDGASPLHREMKEIERKTLARTAETLFGHFGMNEKLLLQAMYSCRPIYNRVAKDRDFMGFRTDLGERAIEDYLYNKRGATDPQNVSLVITEDRGARTSIQRLRGESHNTIFVVGSYGLATALRQLHCIDSLFDVMEPDLMAQVKKRKSWTAEKKAHGQTIDMNAINEPEIERKWSRRLVQVIQTGHWSDTPNREPRKAQGKAAGL